MQLKAIKLASKAVCRVMVILSLIGVGHSTPSLLAADSFSSIVDSKTGAVLVFAGAGGLGAWAGLTRQSLPIDLIQQLAAESRKGIDAAPYTRLVTERLGQKATLRYQALQGDVEGEGQVRELVATQPLTPAEVENSLFVISSEYIGDPPPAVAKTLLGPLLSRWYSDRVAECRRQQGWISWLCQQQPSGSSAEEVSEGGVLFSDVPTFPEMASEQTLAQTLSSETVGRVLGQMKQKQSTSKFLLVPSENMTSLGLEPKIRQAMDIFKSKGLEVTRVVIISSAEEESPFDGLKVPESITEVMVYPPRYGSFVGIDRSE